VEFWVSKTKGTKDSAKGTYKIFEIEWIYRRWEERSWFRKGVISRHI